MRKFFPLGLLVLVVMSTFVSLETSFAHQQKTMNSTPIQHIVFILKENHSFDSLFGSFPGVNGATTGVVKVNGVDQTIPLNPGQNVPTPYCHVFQCTRVADDNGAMDAFNLSDSRFCGKPPYACYQYGGQALIPNYWQLAQSRLFSPSCTPLKKLLPYALDS